MPYKGHVLAEMDLDAILQRKPDARAGRRAGAHQCARQPPSQALSGCRGTAGAGIDVYTTLNVQHLESLNDVVAKITRVRVRETVPDSILDRADDIELVDLTPEDLIQRLKEGKVYVPGTGRARQRSIISCPAISTALRELALRRTAQRVDEQMVNYMRAHAIQGPWEASERVLVCVNERPGAAALVRYARRLADRLRASGRRSMSRPAAARRAERSRARPRRRGAARWPSGSAAQAVTMPAAERARRHHRLRPRQQFHPYRDFDGRSARAGRKFCAASVAAATSSAAPATSACMSCRTAGAREEEAAASARLPARDAARALDLKCLCRQPCCMVVRGAVARPVLCANSSASPTSRWCS